MFKVADFGDIALCSKERSHLVLICYLWGGGGMFFLHFMLFPTFLENNNSGNKFFFMLDLFPPFKKS